MSSNHNVIGKWKVKMREYRCKKNIASFDYGRIGEYVSSGQTLAASEKCEQHLHVIEECDCWRLKRRITSQRRVTLLQILFQLVSPNTLELWGFAHSIAANMLVVTNSNSSCAITFTL